MSVTTDEEEKKEEFEAIGFEREEGETEEEHKKAVKAFWENLGRKFDGKGG